MGETIFYSIFLIFLVFAFFFSYGMGEGKPLFCARDT